MSGVWVFKNGVFRLIENPPGAAGNIRRKVLVYTPTDEVISSHDMLERKLSMHGWERYHPRVDPGILLQFHQPSSLDLISLPRSFSNISSVHMYDVVVKCRNVFEVRDVIISRV